MTLIPDLERDLVEAAEGRMRSVRRRTWRAAAFAVAAVVALAVAIVTFSFSDGGAGPSRPAGDGQRPDTPAPPPSTPRPVPGTLVRLSTFDFRGVQYQLSGYRSRDGSVCMRIKQTPPVAPGLTRPSIMCAGGPSLRRRLRRERVLNVSAGGGPPGRMMVAGFTVAAVSNVRAVGTDWPTHVELTPAWRPLDGERIRAFLIVIKPPRGVEVPRDAYMRIRAVEADR